MTKLNRAPAVYVDCTALTKKVLDEDPALLPEGLEVHVGDPDESALRELLRERRVVVNGHTQMPANVLRDCPELSSIVFLGTGASTYIDLAAAEALGISVHTITGYGDRSIAEHALALIFAGARRIAEMDRDLRAGDWRPLTGVELADRTVGVIGLGGTGREMVRLCASLGMNVLAWNRSGGREPLPGRITEDLDELLSASDVISLHLALKEDTRGFLSRDRLRRMKWGAMLVNTARGALVDEAALIEALTSGQLAHAALDVYTAEPLPPDHPFLSLPNVTLSSHAAFKTPAANRRLIERGLALAGQEIARLQ